MNCGACSIAATTPAMPSIGAGLGGVACRSAASPAARRCRAAAARRAGRTPAMKPSTQAASPAGRIAARRPPSAGRRRPPAPPPRPPRRRPGSARRAGSRRCTRSAMSSKPSVSSSGGSWSATEAGTPVRSEIVRPYSKRVIRRSGAGPGSSAHSGNVSVCASRRHRRRRPAASVARRSGRNDLRSIRQLQSMDRAPAAHVCRRRRGAQNSPMKPKVG